MAIIYSYPSETNIQSSDLLVGTSTIVQNGIKENVTRNFSVGNLAAYLNTIITSVTQITFTAPLTGGTITKTGTVGITEANGTTDGYLSAVDWTRFDNKMSGQSGTPNSIPVFNTPQTTVDSSLTDITAGVFSAKPFSPLTNATSDLGITNTNSWRNLFLSGTANAVDFTGTNLSLTGTLSANGTVGTNGFILQSQGVGQPAVWIANAVGDITEIDTTTTAALNITNGAGPGTVTVDAITGTITGAGTGALATSAEIVTYLANNVGTVTDVISNSQQQLTVTQSQTTPTLNVITGAITGTGTTALATSAEVVTYVTGLGYGVGTLTGVNGTTNKITIDNSTPAVPVINADTSGGVAAGSATLATGDQIQTAISDALVGFLEFKGGFRADSGIITSGVNAGSFLYNCPGGAGTRIAIDIGDFYIVETAGGDFYCSAQDTLAIGDQIVCSTAAAANASLITSWTQIQQNIGVATATALGIANFPTAGGLTIAAGAVSAVGFASVAIAGNAGYVPDATGAAANTFLSKSGTWTTGPTVGITSVATGNGLVGGPIDVASPTGTISPDYTANANNIILAAPNTITTVENNDSLLINDDSGGGVKDVSLSSIKTYIAAGGGTVTSVGLAMPAAFTVTSDTFNPIVGLGTFTVTGAGSNSEVILGDGTLGNLTTGTVTTNGTPTANTIPVFSNSTTIGDSMIAQNGAGTTATVTGALTATGLITGANLTSQGTLIAATITDSLGNTGGANEVLTATASGGSLEWDTAAASYTNWNLAGDSGTPIAITDSTTANIKGSAAASPGGAGIVTVVGATPVKGTITISLVGQATATATNFYRGDGTFAAIPSSAATRVVNRTTAGASTNSHVCGTVSQTNTDFIDVYVTGVYQNKDLYTAAVASGVTTITLTSGTYPNGAIIESITTT